MDSALTAREPAWDRTRPLIVGDDSVAWCGRRPCSTLIRWEERLGLPQLDVPGFADTPWEASPLWGVGGVGR